MMIELELNGKYYNLPTSFSEVNIDTYSKIVSIDKDMKDIDKYVKIISILTGLSESDVRLIRLDFINLISNNIQFMFKTDKVDIVDRFELEGIKYGFNYGLDKISFGQFIDLEDFSKPEEANENLHILMAILYRPIVNFPKKDWFGFLSKNNTKEFKIEEYDGDKVMERAELFKNKLTMDKVLGSMVFFSILSVATTLNSQGYSGKKLKMKLMETMNLVTLEELQKVQAG